MVWRYNYRRISISGRGGGESALTLTLLWKERKELETVKDHLSDKDKRRTYVKTPDTPLLIRWRDGKRTTRGEPPNGDHVSKKG